MIQGIYTALVTPLKQGTVDREKLVKLVERQQSAGVNGLVICATTGEGATLTSAERREVVDLVVQQTAGRLPVVVGMSFVRIEIVLEEIKTAADLGADACLIPSPSYVKPTQEGIFGFFESIANMAKLPIILYNVPSRTASDILPETVERLAAHERIIGIKEATGSIERVQKVIAAANGQFAVLSGDDPITFSLLMSGGSGVICTAANVVPEHWVALWKAYQTGQFVEAARIQSALLPLHDALFAESNPGPVKSALHLLGLVEPEIRLPLTWPKPATVERLSGILEQLGVSLHGEQK